MIQPFDLRPAFGRHALKLAGQGVVAPGANGAILLLRRAGRFDRRYR
jgi:hypothetical protein